MDLVERLRRVDAQRVAWLDRLEALPPERLVARPRPDKWSILEIVDHLVVSEWLVFRGLPDPALLVEIPRRAEHRFRYLLVAFLLRSSIPIRMPSQGLAPQGGRSLSELRRLWDESQSWLLAYAGSLDAAGLRRPVFEHPAAGPLTVGQAAWLNQLHVDRHLRQIEAMYQAPA